MTANGAAPLFREQVLELNKVTKATKEMAGTILVSDSEAIEHRLQLLLKSVVKLSPDMENRMERVFSQLAVLTKPNVEKMVQTGLIEETSTMLFDIVKTVKPTLEETLQACCAISNNGFKTNIVKSC